MDTIASTAEMVKVPCEASYGISICLAFTKLTVELFADHLSLATVLTQRHG